LGWSNLFAEVRSCGRGKWAHPAEPETKITILLDGSQPYPKPPFPHSEFQNLT
jgi:hypothetical protein